MSEQYHEKKQMQIEGENKELAVLSNYPIRTQNTSDNQLYQQVDPNFLTNYQITRDMIEVKNFIGAGAFGQVYCGILRHDNVEEKVAIKVIRSSSIYKSINKENLIYQFSG